MTDWKSRLIQKTPYVLYFPFGAFIIYRCVDYMSREGVWVLMPVFCLPSNGIQGTFCYPATPLNIITLTFFMLGCVHAWRWDALLFTVSAALTFDLIGGGLTTLYFHPESHYAVTLIQIIPLLILVIRFNRRLKFNRSILMFAYLISDASGLFDFLRPLGVYAEPIQLSLYCMAFYNSIKNVQGPDLPR